MARLSEEEQSLFKRLKEKMDAPEAKPVTRSVRANIDLGDPEQVKLARKLGFLDPEDDDDEDEKGKGKGKGKGKDDDDDEEDETPRRRGYFG